MVQLDQSVTKKLEELVIKKSSLETILDKIASEKEDFRNTMAVLKKKHLTAAGLEKKGELEETGRLLLIEFEKKINMLKEEARKVI